MKKIIVLAALCGASIALHNHAEEKCVEVVTGSVNGMKSYGCDQLWHNGAWHDMYMKNGKRGYYNNGKFVTLTPAEVAASNAEKDRLMKQYQ